MNGLGSPFPSAWTPRRLGWTIIGLLVAQVGLIAWFSESQPVARRIKPVPAFAYLILDEPTQTRLALDLAILDPTLFALPHVRNFSGSAWLNLPKIDQDLKDWPDQSPLLALGPASFSSVRTPPERSFQMAYPAIADKPEPRWFEAPVPPEPLPTGTRWHLEGDLALRPVLFMPEWQAWPHNELIRQTVLQLWVDADGLVRDVGLWTECDIPEADRYAIREAKRIRLQPLPQDAVPAEPGRLTAGTLVVQWGTTPAPGTHQPAPSP